METKAIEWAVEQNLIKYPPVLDRLGSLLKKGLFSVDSEPQYEPLPNQLVVAGAFMPLTVTHQHLMKSGAK